MEARLGEGASGVVFRAFDRARGMTVAVKVLTRLDASSLLRFKSEFRNLANISHPNLLQLYDLVARGHEWLLSMELIEGGDFLSYVRPGTTSEAMGALSAPASLGPALAGSTRLRRPASCPAMRLPPPSRASWRRGE